MSRPAITAACIVFLCLAGVATPAAAAAVAPATGADAPVGANPATLAENETESNETSTPVGISLGPIRVTEVTLTEREITEGEQTEIVATVENRGDEPGTIEVTAAAGDIVIDERTVRVEPGETRELRFTFRPEVAGEYLILVNGRSPGVLTVNRVERVTMVDIAGHYVGWSGFVLGTVGLASAVLLTVLLALGRTLRVGTVQLSVRTAEQLWILGSVLLLVGIVAGSGLPFRGAHIGAITLVAYGIYAVFAVIYRSGT